MVTLDYWNDMDIVWGFCLGFITCFLLTASGIHYRRSKKGGVPKARNPTPPPPRK